MTRILQRFHDGFVKICSAKPVTKLSEVDLLTYQDQVELAKWNNDANTVKPQLSCVHHVIKKTGLEQPDAPAILSWDGQFTYRQVNELSNILAHHLRNLGVGPNVIVPLCFNKSLWVVIAVLGTLKAGAAFLLLDSAHPIGRLESIISETSAKVLLCSQTTMDLITKSCDKSFVVSQDTIDSLPQLLEDLQTTVQPSDLACVVFASGSFGAPKGIMLEHSAICTSVAGHGPALHLGKSSRVFQFASKGHYLVGKVDVDLITQHPT